MADEDNKEDNIGSFYMGRMRQPPEPKRILPPGVLTVIALALLGGIMWYAYPRGAEKYTNLDVPVVKADTAPIKEEPVDPGGMEVPHQDSTVFDPLAKTADAQTEKLLPAAEEPLDKTEAIKEAPVATPALPAGTPPQLDMKLTDAGNGVEQIIPPAPEPKPPVTVTAEKKPEPKKVEAKKVEEKPAAKEMTTATSGEKYQLQLGSYRTVDDAKKDWARLQKKFASSLSGLKMKTVKADIAGKGTYYRLQAGPVSKDKADAICDALNAGKQGCIRVK